MPKHRKIRIAFYTTSFCIPRSLYGDRFHIGPCSRGPFLIPFLFYKTLFSKYFKTLESQLFYRNIEIQRVYNVVVAKAINVLFSYWNLNSVCWTKWIFILHSIYSTSLPDWYIHWSPWAKLTRNKAPTKQSHFHDRTVWIDSLGIMRTVLGS